MQPDARKHVVIDTNILCAFLSRKTVHDAQLADRAFQLIDSVIHNDWTPVQIYLPAFAVAEAQHVLDKYRFCKWHGATKKDASKRLTADEYQEASELLIELLEYKSCARVDILPEHIPAASLVSLVNSKYQITRSKARYSGPMSAADCLVAGVAIDLGVRVGSDRVVVVTDDRRMWRVLQRCRRLPDAKAKGLPLQRISSRIGVHWSPNVYPRSILLSRATDKQLAEAFGGWPLPEGPCDHQKCSELTVPQKELLWSMAMQIKNDGGPGPDSLPYTPELDQLQVDFASAENSYLLRADISKTVIGWRKNPKSRPGIFNQQ